MRRIILEISNEMKKNNGKNSEQISAALVEKLKFGNRQEYLTSKDRQISNVDKSINVLKLPSILSHNNTI